MATNRIKLLKTMTEGDTVALFFNDHLIRRRVYFRKDCGLYVVIKNYKYFEYKLIHGEEVVIEI